MNELTTRQKEIINAAIQLIHEGGIQNLSMRNLSCKLKISEPAIYRHFKNKLEVLLSILNYFSKESEKLFESIKTMDSSNLEKIKILFISKCEQFSKNPEYASILFSEEIFQNDNILSHKVLEIMQNNNKHLTKILTQAIDQGEIKNVIPQEHLAIIILGSLRLLVTKWRLTKFSFDITQESINVWTSINKMIIKEN